MYKHLELIDVCNQVTDGSHYSPKTVDKGYPYITVRDVNDFGVIDFENCKFIAETDFQDLQKNGCQPFEGDVLFSKDGTVGKVSLVDYSRDFVVLSSLAIIRPKPEVIYSSYLAYVLRDPKFLKEATGRKTGVAIRRIVLKNLKTMHIPLPSLPEQKRIVAILDEAFAEIDQAIANTEKNLASARELFESYLASLFQKESKGFKLFKGLEAFSTITPKKKIKKKDYLNKGPVPIVAQEAGLINGYWDNEEDITPTNGPVIIFGDHTRVLKYIDFDFAAGADGTKILKAKNVDPLCLFYALKSVDLDEKGYARHFKLIKEAEFYLPEEASKQLDFSKKIKDYENEVLSLEKIYQQKISSLNELKQSLLQKAFSGEITADMADEAHAEAAA